MRKVKERVQIFVLHKPPVGLDFKATRDPTNRSIGTEKCVTEMNVVRPKGIETGGEHPMMGEVDTSARGQTGIGNAVEVEEVSMTTQMI